MVPIKARASSFRIIIIGVFKNKIERKEGQNKHNNLINVQMIITISTDYKYTTNPKLYHTQYIHNNINIIFIYLHTYVNCYSQVLLMIKLFIKMIQSIIRYKLLGTYQEE